MNPDDYDDDGNNIVPCPICMSKYCPSKEDGKCPDEDMFALEGEIRMLLGEYKATDDNSRIANVLEAVEKILHQELQKAREKERGRINQFFAAKADYDTDSDCVIITDRVYHQAFFPDGCKSANECTDCKRYQSELDQPKTN